MERKNLEFEIKSVDFEGRTLEGYGAAFNNLDQVGDVIHPGAFRKTLVDRNHQKSPILFLWQHDPTEPIGRVVEAHEDNQGLFIKAIISDTARGRDALALLKDHAINKMSIGYDSVKGATDYSKDSKGATVRNLREIKLYEISLVTFPANDQAIVTAVKEQDITPSEEKYSDDQPRVPAGDSEGGQWEGGVGGEIRRVLASEMHGDWDGETFRRTYGATREEYVSGGERTYVKVKTAIQEGKLTGMGVSRMGDATVGEAIAFVYTQEVPFFGYLQEKYKNSLIGVVKNKLGPRYIDPPLYDKPDIWADDDPRWADIDKASKENILSKGGDPPSQRKYGRTISAATMAKLKAARDVIDELCAQGVIPEDDEDELTGEKKSAKIITTPETTQAVEKQPNTSAAGPVRPPTDVLLKLIDLELSELHH